MQQTTCKISLDWFKSERFFVVRVVLRFLSCVLRGVEVFFTISQPQITTPPPVINDHSLIYNSDVSPQVKTAFKNTYVAQYTDSDHILCVYSVKIKFFPEVNTNLIIKFVSFLQEFKKRTETAKKEYLKQLAAYRASLVSKVSHFGF